MRILLSADAGSTREALLIKLRFGVESAADRCKCTVAIPELHGKYPLRRERPPIDCLAHLRDLNIAQRVGVEYGISDVPPHILLDGPEL